MESERRTVAGWAHHLEAPDERLTLDEFMALCLLHIREHVKDGRYATEHLEGMIGTLDELLATGDPMYAALAARRGASATAAAGGARPALLNGAEHG